MFQLKKEWHQLDDIEASLEGRYVESSGCNAKNSQGNADDYQFSANNLRISLYSFKKTSLRRMNSLNEKNY